MKFTSRNISARCASAKAFTLAEVLAALVFMAIVIPVALQALSIAGRAGELAERKREAARVAERILTESIVTTNWSGASQSGVVREDYREYRWTMRNDAWSESSTLTAMRLLTVEVVFPIQGEEYTVELSTLANSQ
jgi:type II secretory pathway pseudopilin PulG